MEIRLHGCHYQNRGEVKMSDVCRDNRFEVIAEAKRDLLKSTNIEMATDEMAVIDSILFRCWQMGWLKQYETYEFCDGENPCKEYDQEKHCCHRWTKVIRDTVKELKEDNQKTAKVVNQYYDYLPYNRFMHSELRGDCDSCGETVWKDERYCHKCGAKLIWKD